ncbi:unnamed protein product [Urochloa humidicola]
MPAGGGGGGGGGGDDQVLSRSPAPPPRGQQRGLPLEFVAAIAARSDPVTLVRCAATCSGLRRRLHLRHADRFVPSLLRGHPKRI